LRLNGRSPRTSGNSARPPASRRRSWQRLPAVSARDQRARTGRRRASPTLADLILGHIDHALAACARGSNATRGRGSGTGGVPRRSRRQTCSIDALLKDIDRATE